MANSKERFDRSCRLCAEEQDVTIQIFSPEAETMLLLKKLDKYLLIKIDDKDILPKSICVKCCSKLQTVSDFIETARKSQDVLLARSLALEKVEESEQSLIPRDEVKVEHLNNDDDEDATKMEVNVDPHMVFQNGDLRFLKGADGENVTIKLIRNDMASESNQLMKDVLDNPPSVLVKKILGIKPFACTLCKRSFLTEIALKGHIWIHLREGNTQRAFKCPEPTCLKPFTQRIDFIKHLREHRGRNTCSICGRVTQGNLRIHVESHRTPANAHICTICGRSYDKISNLRTHSITHSSERPFKCHICKKCFKRNQDLKFHINQHTGAKPYKCPFCDKCFASSGNCYSHRNRMHPGRMVETKSRYMRRVINLSREGAEPQTKTVLVKTTFTRRRKP